MVSTLPIISLIFSQLMWLSVICCWLPTRHDEVSVGMELVRSSASMRRPADDDDDDDIDTDFSLISSLTSEQHPLPASGSLTHRHQTSLLVSVVPYFAQGLGHSWNWSLSLDTLLSIICRTNQHACRVTLHSLWSIYFCIVRTYRISGRSTSLLLLWETLLKASTIRTSLILLKMLVFIINCSICYLCFSLDLTSHFYLSISRFYWPHFHFYF